MTLDVETAGALVFGGSLNREREEFMSTIRIRVLRPFYYNKVIMERGTVFEVPRIFALEMISGGKAELIPPEAVISVPDISGEGTIQPESEMEPEVKTISRKGGKKND